MKASRSAFGLVVAAAFAACGGSKANDAPGDGLDGGASDPDAAPPPGLPCDVDAVLATHCRTCHSDPPQFGAPLPLTTWAALHRPSPSDPSSQVYQVVAKKIADDLDPMPPSPNPRLSAADRKTLADWVAGGAPSSSVVCPPLPPQASTALACADADKVSLAPASPYAMPAELGDQYVCWGVDLMKNPARQVTAFAPRIDNTKISHHVVLYETPDTVSPTPTPCKSAASLPWRMVFGWAPGVSALTLPDDVGYPIGTTTPTHYVVQMHYSNPQHLTGQTDASGFDLCTGAPRANEADVLAFGTQSIKIPPQPPPGGVYSLACKYTVPSELAGLHLLAAMPHMHKLGVRMSTVLKPAAAGGGALADLGTQPNFTFETQAWLPLSATIATGDVVTTTCGWTNTTGVEVDFGEKTTDEMCYSFTMYYPRVQASAWSWAIPAISSTCTAL
jgi:cytochrome c551/c552